MRDIILRELADRVVGLGITVHRLLGPGLLEAAYEGAYCVELCRAGIPFERQKVYPLVYKDEYIGAYFADLVVAGSIIVELKAVSRFTPVMEAQLINYLKLSGIQVGYLMNFNFVNLVFKRFVCSRDGCG
ncbi:MAG: GxxExxY protein [Spirochaetales bacterium]|nr:GxxExxY protein [Spirochaetales bacterium]